MAETECDVAIIGAGTAGLAAERSARRAGARTILIDDRFAGTTCATVGCMPSKLLIAAAKAAHAVRRAATFGVHAGNVRVDGRAVMQRVRKMRDEFVSSTLRSIDELPEETRLRGRARFVDATTLDVGGTLVRAGAIVIAAGARPSVPDAFKLLDNVLTNETIFELQEPPSSLAVIGAGPLGLELVQAFARLGVDVEVFDKGGKVGALRDDAAERELRRILEREFPIRLGVSIDAERVADGSRISWSGSSNGTRTFSHVLVASGRPPNLQGLNLDATGLELDERGVPVFDRRTMQCGKEAVFLAGDVDADVPVLHEATAEGAIAGHNAASFPAVRASSRSIPLTVTFTDPPSAVIGSPAGEGTIAGEIDYANQGRARVEARDDGIVRLFADENGKLTGAAMVAPEADHMAHLIAWAIEKGMSAKELLDLPIYHPTYEEGLRNALRQICERAALAISPDRDEGQAPGA